ncbi:NAD-dependent succinate-semialdehyde dehydrogenase [Rhodococcus triatomae]|uniref:Succinate-semialdehyde dehydrogenase / glutarate-semialdehyde dehydrogenase n=1 Tax=Rhodococcus triatomae TaxID=300028 RepID=A0A1G8M1S0_9NOCA|nr:NAD-dependent succinate-semialdehyde dehydrogenase [Rhodococcus triatomae]QNG18214.1 NAD-dependent succinate-semialdehyde dehydrogenase [Rhodococcus triatomae]QNG22115.1 NAD-dependent succinate-semialdehyde dehydrogenase [Rhodococcus triatomae]SDI61896.1 succinate-semialdehyde dehydrogenase / glutarate-semialdehyde dehydrogenase [Rhodococcus triatomae]
MTTYATVNPATGREERRFPTLDDTGVEDVLSRSSAEYQRYRATDPQQRAAILARTADLYEQRAEELARSITTEMGKRHKEALGEVQLAAAIYRWYSEHGPDLLTTEQLDVQGALESVVQLEPVGPLVGVMPWNYPYYQVARFAAPNLMLGNTVILKHAGICPASAQLMEGLLHEAGLPADAYINVFASTDQIAEMIADPRIQGISLTGSERAGASVAETAGRNLTKAVLELGGSDAFIVLDSDDIGALATTAAKARLSNTGQACNSPKRFIVPGEYYDDFVRGVTETFESATVGDPAEPDTGVGPLSSTSARDTVVEQVQRAVEQGATLHTGGDPLPGDGAFMRPAVLTGVTPDMDAYREEIFGPVAVVYRVDSVDEAVQLANDSDFGLSGSVWGTDLDAAQEVADRLEVGMAYVNEHGTTLPGLPFGGVKRSGFGRELGKWGLGEFANIRLRRTSKR